MRKTKNKYTNNFIRSMTDKIQNEKIIWFFNNIDTNNVDSKSHSCAYPITTKKSGI